MHLEGKVALVTGAGSGIGLAIASRFAREGARVVIGDVVPGRVEEAVASIRQAGGSVVGVAGDVSRDEDVGQMIEAAVSSWGGLDILCNNAGVMDQMTPAAQVSDDHWRRILGINLDGAFFACRRAIPVMIERGGGAIVNTASVAGLSGGRAGTAYTVSKHALIGLTRSIAFFYGPQGIRCNAVCPGNIATNIGLGGDPHPFGIGRMMPYFKTVPTAAEPDQIAGAALFLASPDASYVNGTILAVDNGWMAY